MKTAIRTLTLGLVVGLSFASNAAGIPPVPSKVTIDFRTDAGEPGKVQFFGTVTSGDAVCLKDRSVEIYRSIPGADSFAALTTTGADGSWTMRFVDPEGSPMYAVAVPDRYYSGGKIHNCLGDTSEVVDPSRRPSASTSSTRQSPGVTSTFRVKKRQNGGGSTARFSGRIRPAGKSGREIRCANLRRSVTVKRARGAADGTVAHVNGKGSWATPFRHRQKGSYYAIVEPAFATLGGSDFYCDGYVTRPAAVNPG